LCKEGIYSRDRKACEDLAKALEVYLSSQFGRLIKQEGDVKEAKHQNHLKKSKTLVEALAEVFKTYKSPDIQLLVRNGFA
jgi:transaldolase